MSRREQKRREEKRREEIGKEEIRKCLDLYAVELREDLNIRLFCETEEESFIQEQVLWIEDIILTEVVYQQKRKKYVLGKMIAVWKQRIKIWFHNCILFRPKNKKSKAT